MIKIKQLKIIDNECTMDDSKNYSFVNDTIGSQRGSFSPQARKISQPKYYFDFNENKKTVKNEIDGFVLCDDIEEIKTSEDSVFDLENSTIHFGILNLILNCVENVESDKEDLDARLKEAISLFNLMNTNLEENYRNDLDYYNLKLCKQIIISLIEQRTILKMDQNISDENQNNESLQSIEVLIDYITRKVNACLNLNKDIIRTHLKNSFPIIENEDLNRTLEEITPKKNELAEKISELKTPTMPSLNHSINFVQDNTEEKKELEALHAQVKKEQQLLEKQKEEFSKQQLQKDASPTKLSQNSLGNIDIPSPSIAERKEETSKKDLEQEKIDLENAKVNTVQNEKILGLIETMNMQRMAHLKFNTDHLTEQFRFIGDQFNKINGEIKKLGHCSSKRKEILSEFRQIVRDYTAICDREFFIKQFNVFVWLFQQQPNYASNLPEVNANYLQALTSQFQSEMNKMKINAQSNKDSNNAYLYNTVTPPINHASPQKTMNESFLSNISASNSKSVFQTPQTIQSMRPSPSQTTPYLSTNQLSGSNTTLNNNTPKQHLEKQMGEIKFMNNNDDMICKLQQSASKYLEQKNKEENEEEEYYDEDEYYDEEDDYEDDEDYEDEDVYEDYENFCEEKDAQNKLSIISNLSLSRQDTFQSCNENDYSNFSFKSFTKNDTSTLSANDNSHTRSSIKDLEILFESNGNFYVYSFENNNWISMGDSNIQVITDDGMSEKGTFKAFIICNPINKHQSIQYNINVGTNIKPFENSENALCWFNSIENNIIKQALSEDNKCGAILFENNNLISDMKKAIAKCQMKLPQMSPTKKSLSSWSPVKNLPNLKLNTQTKSLFNRKIDMFINELDFKSVSIIVNEFSDRNLSGNSLLINFDQNSNNLLQHAINFKQNFQINENQNTCTYTVPTESVITDNLNSNIKLMNPLVFKLIFSNRNALMEFLSLFDH